MDAVNEISVLVVTASWWCFSM